MKIIILWQDSHSWEIVDGTLTEAIERVRFAFEHYEYGSKGAIVIEANAVYKIEPSFTETFKPWGDNA